MSNKSNNSAGDVPERTSFQSNNPPCCLSLKSAEALAMKQVTVALTADFQRGMNMAVPSTSMTTSSNRACLGMSVAVALLVPFPDSLYKIFDFFHN